MPIVVAKSARKPSYVDAPVPEVALRREHAIASRHEPAYTRAYMRMTRGLLSRGVKSDLLQALRLVVIGEMTQGEALNVVPWFNPADPLATQLWNALSGSLRSTMTSIMEDAGETEMRAQGWPLKFTVEKAAASADIRVPINPFSIDFIRNRSVRMVAGISGQQRDLLRQVMADGFEKGLRPTAMLEEIEDVVGLTVREWQALVKRNELLEKSGVTGEAKVRASERYKKKLLKARARRIARTEAVETYNRGLVDSWKLAKGEGLIEPTAMKEWQEITFSPRTCKICRGLARQRVPLDEPFVSEIIGEVDGPPGHPSCRCTQLLVFPENKEEIAFAVGDVLQTRRALAGG